MAKLSSVGQTEGGSISYLQLQVVARWFPYYVQEWPGVIILPNYNVCAHSTCFNFLHNVSICVWTYSPWKCIWIIVHNHIIHMWMFNLWIRKIPWRRKWQPIPVFFLGISHGHSLVGYSPWGHKRVRHDLVTKTTTYMWIFTDVLWHTLWNENSYV